MYKRIVADHKSDAGVDEYGSNDYQKLAPIPLFILRSYHIIIGFI